MTPKTRKPRPNQKAEILAAAVSLAKSKGLRNFARIEIATLAQVAEATVSFHLGKMDEVRRAIVEYAIDNEVIPVLVDARADRSSGELYTRMSADLKQKIAAHIAR